jgi:hypothetical protein
MAAPPGFFCALIFDLSANRLLRGKRDTKLPNKAADQYPSESVEVIDSRVRPHRKWMLERE